jgi:hypothetical protein
LEKHVGGRRDFLPHGGKSAQKRAKEATQRTAAIRSIVGPWCGTESIELNVVQGARQDRLGVGDRQRERRIETGMERRTMVNNGTAANSLATLFRIMGPRRSI